jgi:hypothetical protein
LVFILEQVVDRDGRNGAFGCGDNGELHFAVGVAGKE